MLNVDTSNELTQFSNTLHQFINQRIDEWGLVVIGFAALGVFASSLVNYIKDFVRPAFFRYFLRKQLRSIEDNRLSAEQLENNIVAIATGDLNSFYKQALSGIIASLGRVYNSELIMLQNLDPTARGYKGRVKQSKKLFFAFTDPDYPSSLRKSLNDDINNVASNTNLASAVDAVRVSNIKSKVDSQILGFQIRTQDKWDTAKRSAAMLISILTALFFYRHDGPMIEGFLLSVAAGAFAPYAHDLLKSLRSAKVA